MNCVMVDTTSSSSSGEPSESNGDDQMMESLADQETSLTASSSLQPEPTRGVKKTSSLRRGAAVYAELLQSAVRASIESRGVVGENDLPQPEIPTMQQDDSSRLSRLRNKRSSSSSESECVVHPKKSFQRHGLR